MSKPKIIITIDTEVGEKAKFVEDGFEKFILGRIGDKYWGVPKILEALDKYDIKGEFFVDVYEDRFFGEEKYAELCQSLDEQGHGVQLHTHPAYAYDINRINMHEYSLEEQISIIREGKERIKKWIGKNPIAHRAGNYGANNDTLLALKANEISIDSSFYYGHPNCKIKIPTINDQLYYENILEIPVSVNNNNQFISKIFPFSIKYPKKIDINFMNLKNLINSIKKYNSAYLTLFLHSSSFIKRNQDLVSVSGFNRIAFENFSNVLEYIYNNNYLIIKFSKVKNNLW